MPCKNVSVGKVSSLGYVIPIGGITYISPSQQVDYYSSIYELSPEQMDIIANNGIKKIRISSGMKYRDKEFINNSLGKFLMKCRMNIQERIDNPLKKKDVFDDF